MIIMFDNFVCAKSMTVETDANFSVDIKNNHVWKKRNWPFIKKPTNA